MKELADTVFTGVLILFLLTALYTWMTTAGYDDSDNKELEKRSGMRIYTDYGTGNQYFGTCFTGLVPRVDARGKQVNIYSNSIQEKL